MVKTDSSGNKQWDQTFGGSGFEYLSSLAHAPDGGYVLGGYSSSGGSGNKTSPGFGDQDFWIIKLDQGGTKQWERAFGGNGADTLQFLILTSDGGYLLAGSSASGTSGNKTSANLGGRDYWVSKFPSVISQ